jgi:hypothetical protein
MGPHRDPGGPPRALGDLGEATGRAAINFEGVCGTTEGGHGVIHVLVADDEATRTALSEAGFEVRGERNVLVIDVEERRGRWARSRAGSATPA